MANEMRDRLVELCGNAILSCKVSSCEDCEQYTKNDYPYCMAEYFADRLIENGVIVPLFKNKSDFVKIPCKCKECEHFNNDNPDSTYCEEHSDGWGDNRVYVDEDDYCSFGIRKKGGADNG